MGSCHTKENNVDKNENTGSGLMKAALKDNNSGNNHDRECKLCDADSHCGSQTIDTTDRRRRHKAHHQHIPQHHQTGINIPVPLQSSFPNKKNQQKTIGPKSHKNQTTTKRNWLSLRKRSTGEENNQNKFKQPNVINQNHRTAANSSSNNKKLGGPWGDSHGVVTSSGREMSSVSDEHSFGAADRQANNDHKFGTEHDVEQDSHQLGFEFGPVSHYQQSLQNIDAEVTDQYRKSGRKELMDSLARGSNTGGAKTSRLRRHRNGSQSGRSFGSDNGPRDYRSSQNGQLSSGDGRQRPFVNKRSGHQPDWRGNSSSYYGGPHYYGQPQQPSFLRDDYYEAPIDRTQSQTSLDMALKAAGKKVKEQKRFHPKSQQQQNTARKDDPPKELMHIGPYSSSRLGVVPVHSGGSMTHTTFGGLTYRAQTALPFHPGSISSIDCMSSASSSLLISSADTKFFGKAKNPGVAETYGEQPGGPPFRWHSTDSNHLVGDTTSEYTSALQLPDEADKYRLLIDKETGGTSVDQFNPHRGADSVLIPNSVTVEYEPVAQASGGQDHYNQQPYPMAKQTGYHNYAHKDNAIEDNKGRKTRRNGTFRKPDEERNMIGADRKSTKSKRTGMKTKAINQSASGKSQLAKDGQFALPQTRQFQKQKQRQRQKRQAEEKKAVEALMDARMRQGIVQAVPVESESSADGFDIDYHRVAKNSKDEDSASDGRAIGENSQDVLGIVAASPQNCYATNYGNHHSFGGSRRRRADQLLMKNVNIETEILNILEQEGDPNAEHQRQKHLQQLRQAILNEGSGHYHDETAAC